MAQITIQNKIEKNKKHQLINYIYHVCQTNPNLSPRSKKEIINSYENGFLLIALDGSTIAGWVMRIPYTKNFQELAAGYIEERYQTRGIFTKLINTATLFTPLSLLVTFNISFAESLIKKGHCTKSSLLKAILLSRGIFLLSRINKKRLLAIQRHYKTSNAVYVLFNRYE